MNWEAIGSIGEAFGAIGVIVTLIYLASQIRQNTSALKTTSLESVMNSWRVINREVILGNRENRSVFYRGMNDYEQLTQDEKQVFAAINTEFVLVVHHAWQLHQRGIIDKVDLDAWANLTLGILRTPGGATHWAKQREGYTPTIMEYLDKELEAGAGQPSLIESMPFWDAKFDPVFNQSDSPEN